jgi:dTDP-4-dehydrorhamnose reductase
MKWLVAGAGGMLGSDMVDRLRARGEPVTAATRGQLDITDPVACESMVNGHDVVVNAAAWTAVDDAESHEAAAFDVNAVGAANLAMACAAHTARIVHISTDYVFDGASTVPYPEDAPLAPRAAYGRTKAAGEWAVRAGCADHLVVRTAWLYGAEGPCFPKTIARLAGQRDRVTVVADQIGQPTWSRDLAELVIDLVGTRAPAGVYHGTAAGKVSWHGFARAIVGALGLDPAMVVATTTEEFPRPAYRPPFSVLGHDALVAAARRDGGPQAIGAWDERWTAAAGVVLADAGY